MLCTNSKIVGFCIAYVVANRHIKKQQEEKRREEKEL